MHRNLTNKFPSLGYLLVKYDYAYKIGQDCQTVHIVLKFQPRGHFKDSQLISRLTFKFHTDPQSDFHLSYCYICHICRCYMSYMSVCRCQGDQLPHVYSLHIINGRMRSLESNHFQQRSSYFVSF